MYTFYLYFLLPHHRFTLVMQTRMAIAVENYHYLQYRSRFVRAHLSICGVYSIMPEQSAVAGLSRLHEYSKSARRKETRRERKRKRERGGERAWPTRRERESEGEREEGCCLSDEIGAEGEGSRPCWKGRMEARGGLRRREGAARSRLRPSRERGEPGWRAIAVRPPTTTRSVSTILLTDEFFSHRRRLR